MDSGSWWWTRRPGMLQFMGSQRVRHDWATELNWSECLVFCDCGFQSVHLLMEKDKWLMETSWWERLRGNLGFVLMGGVMLSKSLIQFSVGNQDLLELTPQKDVLFIIGDWNAKVGSQETLGVKGKFDLGVQKEAGQRLIQFCQENALVIVNTLFQQHKRRLYTWTSPDSQYRNQIDYILCSQRWRSSI